MAQDAFCVIELDGWGAWWEETRRFRWEMYISVVLFFLSAVLARPIARSAFFLVRQVSPKKWLWPDDARNLMMWQTALVCRAGLLWIALRVSRISVFLCQWPSWLFGVCFIIWMDAGGNVLREIIVRKGLRGYTEDEQPGRLTLLYEGTTLAKSLLLMVVVYTYYLVSLIGDDNKLRLVSSTGFFLAVAMSLLPLLRNVMGAHYMFLSNMLHLRSRIRLQRNAAGTISDTPLGFLVLDAADTARTFVPAGGAITSTLKVYEDIYSPVHIEIRLPSTESSADIRAFMQKLDLEMATRSPIQGLVHRRHRSYVRSAETQRSGQNLQGQVSAGGPSKREEEAIKYAHQLQPTIAIKPNTRWIVCIDVLVWHGTTRELVQIRSKLVEEIAEVVGNCGIEIMGDLSIPSAQ